MDIFEIGTIYFTDSINEAEITSKKSRFSPKHIGECKVHVYGPDEGNIPHFHIFNKDHSFECCVRIYENYFFPHGGKYTDVLNTSQCRELNNWLMKINDKVVVAMTNWQTIVSMWEVSNPNCRYPESRKTKIQPHYESMSMFKDN